ncbi:MULTISPECIES: O-methyltransferase [unclassified Caballeronia]|uniref:O-methyltransferase n=1 Tax=unclassified Caballeronia TaxID=2646786 RepID=UPI002867679E|nr:MULTISPECIES: O-methyltransferase [unclassified Caballeronia]MDR5816854.1 O-methyltransferase [Caballeronia sp. LZ033]MDR5823764.1 O-methyltransferase [Caballeronia sp. LZ043]MDR5881660.1 O-methyltransferase [Caballeronia sp. LZ032]
MNEQQWIAMDEYLCERTQAPDEVLEAALRDSVNAGLPAINVAPNQGKMLHMLAKLRGARRILELGTLGGYSTIWLARALPSDGTLLTLEAVDAHAHVARGNLARAGLSSVASVIVGDAVHTLRSFVRDGIPPFDFIFLDADKKSYPAYLDLVLLLSRPGTLIVADNVIRRGRVLETGSDDPDVNGVRTFFDMLATHPRLDSTAIQTVGSKGWDGFSMSIVTE